MSTNRCFYLAVQADSFGTLTRKQQLELMLNLTPQVMAWDKNIWLLDLSPCHGYWQARATALQTDTTNLWRSLLHQLLMNGSETNLKQSHIGASAPYYAALANKPWQAILALNHLRERCVRGFIDTRSQFGASLLNEMSWQAWWHSVAQIRSHLATIYTAFDTAAYARSCKKMQQTMQKISSQLPRDMRSADAASIKRRFGGWLSLLWSWTYEENNPDSETLFDVASGFPWIREQKQDAPQITRHLESPVHEWSHLEELLREDFNKLCQLTSWDFCDRVTTMQWTLTLDDMTQRSLLIGFRHPHSLHNQAPEQKTALMQASYSFVAVTSGEPLPAAIVGWSLSITGQLLVNSELGAILDDSADPELHELLELDNQLPIALEAYDLSADWQAEYSFTATNSQAAGARDSVVSEAQYPSYLVLAQKRPLYLLKQPEPLTQEVSFPRQAFLERSMQRWWTSIHRKKSSLCRSYYHLRLASGQSIWAYHDDRHRWFKHGIFA